MTDMEKKIAFLLSTSQYLVPAWECTYDEAAKDLVANGVTVQKWIPVTERLPEFKKDVLVIQNNSDRSMAVWRLFRSAISNLLYWEDETGDGRALEAATHWMPLPQPPKEGE